MQFQSKINQHLIIIINSSNPDAKIIESCGEERADELLVLQSIYGEENVVDFGDVDIMDGFVSTLQIRLFATESPDIQIGVLDVCFKEEKQEEKKSKF